MLSRNILVLLCSLMLLSIGVATRAQAPSTGGDAAELRTWTDITGSYSDNLYCYDVRAEDA
jgi:hypothetical protein